MRRVGTKRGLSASACGGCKEREIISSWTEKKQKKKLWINDKEKYELIYLLKFE